MKTRLLFLIFISVGFSCIPLVGRAQWVGAGTAHTIAVCNQDSSVFSWGANNDGQLGVNDTIQSNKAGAVHGPGNSGFLAGVKMVVARENYSLALMKNGTVWGWGYNGDGELGNNSAKNALTPVQVHGMGNIGFLTGIKSISGGYAHVLALTNDGKVYAWGDNANGELGNDSRKNDSVPVLVHGPNFTDTLTGITAIAAGQQFSLALKNDGTVWAWGENDMGELGNNTLKEEHIPTQVHGRGNNGFLNGVTAIAAGGGHSLALTADSTVSAWGFNINGELGNNTVFTDSVPARVHGTGNLGYLPNIVAIAAGDYFSGALDKDSFLWEWGYNHYGQLGQNDTVQRNTPVIVPNETNALKVSYFSLGDEHVVAYNPDGKLRAWGWNGNGQLGDATNTDRWLPELITSPCSVNTGIQGGNYTNNFPAVFPNPSMGQFTIAGAGEISMVQIYNIQGQSVLETTNLSGQNTIGIDISSLPNGIYFLRMVSGNNITAEKIIIEK